MKQIEQLIARTGLKVGQSIDYKSATEVRTSIGKVMDFKQAPETPDSLWMQIQDAEDATQLEWISCAVWEEQCKAGLFVNRKTTVDASNEPTGVEEYPF